jgi:pimeloyl-ACP methyl ester carboxylesterase
MNASRQLALIAALFLQLLPSFADDVITNIMSPIASYQYPNNFSSESLTNGGVVSPFVSYQYLENFSAAALTNGGIMSPIASYQYYEWPGSGILNLQYSPTVSYYYPFLDTPPLTIISTNRTPTTAEITPLLAALPTPSQLMAFHGGIFTTNLASIDPNQMTVVLTHGWRDDPYSWATSMANLIHNNLPSPSPNIVVWDWSLTAKSAPDDPGIPAAQTGDQGRALGEKLLLTLGANYSKPIHFVGHSLGTLVNASAANYLQGTNWANEDISPTPWLATNMQMTLFDEAEVATGQSGLLNGIRTLIGWNGNPLEPKPSYYHPLPKHFAWADNYVSAFGLLHPEVANVILTKGSPTDAPNPLGLYNELQAFHGYPMNWYDETIQTDVSAMGFLWSFERGGWFSQAPATNSVYVQTSSEWNLSATNWNYGTNFLNARFQKYQSELVNSSAQFVENMLFANGSASGQAIWDIETIEWLFSLNTTAANSAAPQLKAHPLGLTPNGSGGSANIPAYTWIPLFVPTNAVAMSFDYKIQGDWQSDSLVAAFNGTNVLLIAGNKIQTNVTFSSGAIDVSAFAGQTNEFFIGIIGGTSTNAQLTVENLAFSVSLPPSLQAQMDGGNLMLSWPMSSQNFSLQTTTNLADPNSWTTLPNVPAIVNLQNAVTNPVVESQRFYRLKQ